MLCEKCATLPIHGPGHNWTVPHYSTYIELDESSKSGCNVCTLFKTVTLDYYADSLSCTIDEADRHHRSLDRLLPRANISEVKNTLLKDFQKGHVGSKSTEGVDDGEDKYDEDDEDKGENDNSGDEENVRGPVEAFFVRAGSVRIDSDFAGPAEGLHSLQYIRRERIDSFGFNKVCPTVQISHLGNGVYMNGSCI
jgi:hypothetical protein